MYFVSISGIVSFILLLIIFLYKTNQVFRYYFKFTTWFFIVMSTSCFALLRGLFRPRDVRNIRLLARFWAFIFKIFGITYEIRNGEYLKSDKPYVLVSNHQSSLDVIAMMTLWPERCTALAKKELFYFGPFGPAAWLYGLVFIDRLNHEKARGTLESTAQLMHDRNIKLWVFPEGTRSPDDDMLPFKKGSFNLAVQAQVPIVPVVLSCYRHFHHKKKKIFNPGHVIVTCLPPVPTEGLEANDVPQLTERVRSDMVAVYKSSSVEVEEYARKIGNTEILDLIKESHEE